MSILHMQIMIPSEPRSRDYSYQICITICQIWVSKAWCLNPVPLQVEDTLKLTETLDSGSRAVVYVVFGAAVYDVEVSTVISNQPGEPVSMKVRKNWWKDSQ